MQPTFHLAPVVLDAPADSDAHDAHRGQTQAHQQLVPAELGGMSSKRLTLQAMTSGARRAHALAAGQPAIDAGTSAAGSSTGGPDGVATPMAAATSVSTYTPAQIRSAYNLPDLPAEALGSAAGLSAQVAAQLGAGQTIYIVNAMHDPNVVAELNAFNQKFALPSCSVRSIAVTASLPLAPANAADGCTFSVVYSTATGGMRSTAPAYAANWATEIALDVQWAHATAPLARIILIEAPDATLDGLSGGVKLANAMGPGTVSMSFGAGEGSWTSTVDASTFSTPQMTYLAATGDSGAEVNWPAVSPKVLAVGGTRLSYSGSGARSETGWSGTGGGVSAYVATPDYQKSGLPGVNGLARRGVADVAFNADPGTGQYVAVISPGASTPNWVSAGGTSLSTPQWAGVVAIANAQRALAGKGPVGLAHTLLYGDIGATAGSYASAFADITTGSDGSCASCSARSGYDQLTGLGTPNTSALLALLSGAGDAAPAPVVSSAAIDAYAGVALNFTVPVQALNTVSWSLAGAPTGMAIGSNGVVSWPKPVLGNVAVTVTAKDSRTGLSGSGVYTVRVAPAPVAPTVSAATVSAKAGSAISYSVNVQASNPVTWTLSGQPAGMSINGDGVISWPLPVAGSPAVTVTARDSKTGLSGKAVITFKIEVVPVAPVVANVSASGLGGMALSVPVKAVATNGASWALRNAPAGMVINATTGVISWPKPVQGDYQVIAVATDKKNGLSGQGTVTLAIEPVPVPPVVQAARIDGVAGSAAGVTLDVTATHALSWTLARPPAGMTISSAGVVSWPNPTAGAWTVVVTAKDTRSGLTGSNKLTVHIEAVPTLTGTTVNGKERTALSFKATAKAGHAVTYELAGAPEGMVISAAGQVSWAAPVPGSWSVRVTATDVVNHLSGSAVWTVKVVAVPLPPVIEAAALNGKVGVALSGLIKISDPKNTGLAISITGVPWDMTLDTSAFSTNTLTPNFPIYWASPVAGKYTIKVVAKNGAGLTTTVNLPVTIVR
ncbi:MAG: hypothetical protein RIQ60_2396 [Pseudomonadota bacterium]|jgi:hypothetical protein